MVDIAYVVAGLVVGLAVGLTGIGGGSLMTPILVLGFGVSPATAVGTDLLYASLTKITGVWVYHRRAMIIWRVVLALLAGSIPASLLTLAFLKGYASSAGLEQIINPMLSLALILTSIALLFRDRLRQWGEARAARRGLAPDQEGRSTGATVAIGAVLGVLVTLSSVGAGALGTIALLALYPAFIIQKVVGTELAHAVLLTGVAGLGHWHLGTVDFTLLASLLAGSLPGVYLGSHLGLRLPEKYIRPVMASMLFFIGIRFAI